MAAKPERRHATWRRAGVPFGGLASDSAEMAAGWQALLLSVSFRGATLCLMLNNDVPCGLRENGVVWRRGVRRLIGNSCGGAATVARHAFSLFGTL